MRRKRLNFPAPLGRRMAAKSSIGQSSFRSNLLRALFLPASTPPANRATSVRSPGPVPAWVVDGLSCPLLRRAAVRRTAAALGCCVIKRAVRSSKTDARALAGRYVCTSRSRGRLSAAPAASWPIGAPVSTAASRVTSSIDAHRSACVGVITDATGGGASILEGFLNSICMRAGVNLTPTSIRCSVLNSTDLLIGAPERRIIPSPPKLVILNEPIGRHHGRLGWSSYYLAERGPVFFLSF